MSRTEMTRSPEKASADRIRLNDLLDEIPIVHVGLVTEEGPVVIPTAGARDGENLLIHGSTGSGWMRRLATGAPACVTVTAVDALVVARSAFESSYRYRSAVMFGAFRPVQGEAKERALDILVDKLIPGRVGEIRRSTAKELSATMVLALPLQEWSLRISDDWPDDRQDDVDGPAWAGVVPLRTTYGSPVPSPDLRAGVPVPESVERLAGGPPTIGVDRVRRPAGEDHLPGRS